MPQCTDCPHEEHEADQCAGLVTLRYYGGDADDQPCPCDLGPLSSEERAAWDAEFGPEVE